MRWLALLICLAAGTAQAGMLTVTRTVPSRTILSFDDLRIAETPVAGALTDPAQAVGQEARVTLYPGRPLRPGDIGPPAVIERNEIVVLRYRSGALVIEAEGRALDRAAAGDRIRVMNLSSRAVVTGAVLENGLIEVGR